MNSRLGSSFGSFVITYESTMAHEPAEVLQKEFGNTFQPAVMAELDRYEIILKLLENGTNKEPFTATTLAPLNNRVGRRNKLIARSRERFASPRTEIEDKLGRWLN